MTRFSRIALALLIASLSTLASAGIDTFQANVAVTSTNTVVTPSPAKPSFVRVFNDGPGVMYLDFDRVAVAASATAYAVLPCEAVEIAFDNEFFTTAGLITAANVTTNARFTAHYMLDKQGRGPYTAVIDKVKWFKNDGCLTSATTGPNGSGMVPYIDSELITLNTGTLTTDSTNNLLHARSLIDFVGCHQVVPITTSTNWGLSDPTTANRFAAATTIATADLYGFDQWLPTGAGRANSAIQDSAAKLRITMTVSNPGAGQLRCIVVGRTYIVPVS